MQMAIHNFTVASRKDGDLEAELAAAAAHAIDNGVVLARVACVENQPVNRPTLNPNVAVDRGAGRRSLGRVPSLAIAEVSRQ